MAFEKEAMAFSDRYRKFLRPKNYINKLRRIFINPHYAEEGDLHTFADDHIEWEKIKNILIKECEIIKCDEYLSYNGYYDVEKYNKSAQSGLKNMQCLVAKKR